MPDLTVVFFALICLSFIVQGWVFRREALFQKENSSAQVFKLARSRLIHRSFLNFIDLTLVALVLLAYPQVLAGEGPWDMATALTGLVLLRALLRRCAMAYQQFGPETSLGRHQGTFGLFLRDSVIQGALLLIAAIPLSLLALWILTNFGSEGWFLVGVLWAVLSALRTQLYPVFIAPLFNKFEPLQDENLLSDAVVRVENAGCRLEALQVMDGSTRSANGNAKVEGMGQGKRVILLDTLFDRLDRPEILAVISHELGHIKKHHVLKYEIILALLRVGWVSFAGFVFLSVFDYHISLFLLMSSASLFMFYISPALCNMIRNYEFEADAFAKSTGDEAGLASALKKLNLQNIATPKSDPFYRFFFHSHPEDEEREERLLGKIDHAPHA